MFQDWAQAVEDGLSPQEVAAALVMRSILTSDIPMICAWWLAAGRETPTLGELAGAPTDDIWSIDDLWSTLCDELGITRPTKEDAAIIDVRRILDTWKKSRVSTITVLSEFERMTLYEYDDLDTSAGLLDELEEGWGRSRTEVIADANRRMTKLLAELGARPSWPSAS